MSEFNPKNPTTQMLGRWQPWHDGHTELFKRAHNETGQVCIMIRDVAGQKYIDVGGGRTSEQRDNPFEMDQVKLNIVEGLKKAGFTYGVEYVIMSVPNIVDISYGRGVGYTFTEHDLGKEVHDISATKIRAKMREEGTLAN
jgi:phosphopantetheine adenylyltransferase